MFIVKSVQLHSIEISIFNKSGSYKRVAAFCLRAIAYNVGELGHGC